MRVEEGEQLGQQRIVLRRVAMARHERQVAPENMRVRIHALHDFSLPWRWSTRSRAATESSVYERTESTSLRFAHGSFRGMARIGSVLRYGCTLCFGRMPMPSPALTIRQNPWWLETRARTRSDCPSFAAASTICVLMP